jgi:hypothetical protein
MTILSTRILVQIIAALSFFLSACHWTKNPLRPSEIEDDFSYSYEIPQPKQGPKSGRYVGLSWKEESQRKFHIVLDLAYTGRNNYRVFIRLSPSEDESMEYTSFHFSDANYQEKKLRFRNPNTNDLSGILEELENGQLRGSFNSTKTGKALVSFETTKARDFEENFRGKRVFSEFPWKRSKERSLSGISGYYAAQNCAPHIRGLYLESYKESSLISNDSSGLQISGRLVQQDEILCRGKNICLAESYTKGIFEPFSGSILLDGWIQKRTCIYDKDTINCDLPCTFSKAKDNQVYPIDKIKYHHTMVSSGPSLNAFAVFEKLTRIPTVLEPPQVPLSPWSSFEGQFYGYIYHQSLGAYQLLALNNEISRHQTNLKKNYITPLATLYFGEGDSSEFIAFPFDSVEVPIAQNPIVFDGHGDGMMIIRQWTKEGVIGDWYSKSYGYVGPLSLFRGNVPTLPSGAKLIQPISGAYIGSGPKGAAWNLEITATPDISDVGGAFYPLKVYGFAKEQIDFARRRLIEKGSYHFYTGRLFFRLDDQRVIVGRTKISDPYDPGLSLALATETDDGLELFWSPNPRVGTDIDQGKAMVFKRAGPYPEPRAVVPSRNRSE